MAEPLNRAMKQLFPAVDVPLLKVRDPVTPLDTTFAELMVIAPEPELTLEPLVMATVPPSAPPDPARDTPARAISEPPEPTLEELAPAFKTIPPATPESDSPIVTLIEPPLPPVELPD